MPEWGGQHQWPTVVLSQAEAMAVPRFCTGVSAWVTCGRGGGALVLATAAIGGAHPPVGLSPLPFKIIHDKVIRHRFKGLDV